MVLSDKITNAGILLEESDRAMLKPNGMKKVTENTIALLLKILVRYTCKKDERTTEQRHISFSADNKIRIPPGGTFKPFQGF